MQIFIAQKMLLVSCKWTQLFLKQLIIGKPELTLDQYFKENFHYFFSNFSLISKFHQCELLIFKFEDYLQCFKLITSFDIH